MQIFSLHTETKLHVGVYLRKVYSGIAKTYEKTRKT